MLTPGAAISGLVRWLTPTGPRLEKYAVASVESTAPTVRADVAQPGLETVFWPDPMLPAAMTNRLLLEEDSLLTACAIGSSQVVAGVGAPRLIEMTSALLSTAHCMPAMMSESYPAPESPSTLPISRLAPGAT